MTSGSFSLSLSQMKIKHGFRPIFSLASVRRIARIQQTRNFVTQDKAVLIAASSQISSSIIRVIKSMSEFDAKVPANLSYQERFQPHLNSNQEAPLKWILNRQPTLKFLSWIPLIMITSTNYESFSGLKDFFDFQAQLVSI
jgi:hypothetical protein